MPRWKGCGVGKWVTARGFGCTKVRRNDGAEEGPGSSVYRKKNATPYRNLSNLEISTTTRKAKI